MSCKINRKKIIEEYSKGIITPGVNIYVCKETNDIIVKKHKPKVDKAELIAKIERGENVPEFEVVKTVKKKKGKVEIPIPIPEKRIIETDFTKKKIEIEL